MPPELLARRQLLAVIEEAYRRYGFQPLETPAIEYLDILTGKSDENDKLIYEIRRARGEDEDSAETAIALRYDLTVPLARVIAQYPEMPRPFKRYQIQPVWRADRPQPRQGRFREFVQCDADIIGTTSVLADAEIIALTYEVLRDLDFEGFCIRLSSRTFLSGLSELITGDASRMPTLCRCLDKLDKIGWDGVEKELAANGLPAETAKRFCTQIDSFAGTQPDFPSIRKLVTQSEAAMAGLTEIEAVFAAARGLGVLAGVISVDATLARGLDYYTGPIFETVLPDHPHIGSLTGGGRYDRLVESFSKVSVPATGTTIGLDRIQTALTQLGKFAPVGSTTQILIARFDSEGMTDNLSIAAELRKAAMNVEVWYDDDRMKKQLAYADQQKIPLVIICGPDERKIGRVSVKNMRKAEQHSFARAELTESVKRLLSAL